MQIKMRAVWIERLQESLLKPAVPGEGAGGGAGPFPLAEHLRLEGQGNRAGTRARGGPAPREHTGGKCMKMCENSPGSPWTAEESPSGQKSRDFTSRQTWARTSSRTWAWGVSLPLWASAPSPAKWGKHCLPLAAVRTRSCVCRRPAVPCGEGQGRVCEPPGKSQDGLMGR